MIPHFVGLRKAKQMVGPKEVYDHSIANNSGLNRSEVSQCYELNMCTLKKTFLMKFF